jgi:hypothetical protein
LATNGITIRLEQTDKISWCIAKIAYSRTTSPLEGGITIALFTTDREAIAEFSAVDPTTALHGWVTSCSQAMDGCDRLFKVFPNLHHRYYFSIQGNLVVWLNEQ